ncbi:MAG TPA: hypothetical protein VNW46_01660 [Gemmatimonadaceae bacterium]|nr:hypothetical protein [Gemmatimonadaceae bacterium]
MRRLFSSGVVACAVALASLAGCVGDPTATIPQADPTKLFWSLTLNHRAITMATVAPYDTIRLVATPRTIGNVAITGLGTPTFQSEDQDHALVDSNGVVHAIGAADQVAIIASLMVGNILHVDTAIINITAGAPGQPLAQFSIQPIPPDSAKTAVQLTKAITANAYDASGSPISNVSVYFSLSDTTTATIDRTFGFLSALHPGHVTVYATTTTYGVTKTDSLRFRIGYPIEVFTQAAAHIDATGKTVLSFVPQNLVIGPGGLVLFGNTSPHQAIDVTFDDPTNVQQSDMFCAISAVWWCGGGDIAAWTVSPTDSTGESAVRVRQFFVPGTYPFHSTIFGTTGSIVVKDDKNL